MRPYQGEQHLVYFGDKRPADGWLEPVLDGTRILVGFNIKFDVLHAIYNQPKNLSAWMRYVASGGTVWDCQLAEYLLNGMTQRDQMLSLDEAAPRYGGQLKHDEVKALWESGVNTTQIDRELLERYLGGGPNALGDYQPGDLENTETVAVGQIKRAREAGQYDSIALNMGSLLCSIEMERNGMFVDVARGREIAGELAVKLRELEASLQAFLPELPFEFNWASTVQKSALIFGGKIKYPRREYLLAKDYGCFAAGDYVFNEAFAEPGDMAEHIAYAQKDETHYILADGSTCECSWWEHCLATEWAGEAPEGKDRVLFAGGKNAGEPKTRKVKVPDRDKPKSRMGEDYFVFPRLTQPKPEWAGAEEGVWSTSAAVIEELGTRDLPFLKALAAMQALAKDLGTYYVTTGKDGVEKGMLTLVGADGIIHHSINHTSTVTGRFSSSDPNLQNVPKGNKSDVKTLFVSRFGADGTIIQSDFSSLEVYVQAILTHCDQLIADLRAGVDMHVMRLSVKEGKPYDEVLLLCKGDKKRGVEAVKEWDYKRTGAKVFSFQRAYGAGVGKIAATTGMSEEEVEALVAAESLRYPEIDAYYEDLTDTIKRNRRPGATFVPHPVTKQVCQLGTSTYRTPDGKLYAYQESPSPEWLAKRGTLASFSPTEIKNYVVQGTGGEWMKAAMWLMVRAFYARNNFDGKALLVNTVHDAAYADAHNSVRFEAAALIHACMESASDMIEYTFDWPIPVPVPSDTTWGASMMDEDQIDGVREAAAALRKTLREEYMDGYVPSFI